MYLYILFLIYINKKVSNNLHNKEPLDSRKHKHNVNELLIKDENYLKISELIKELLSIAEKVEKSIYKHGVFKDQETDEKYFAYEVDCFGNHYFIDDPGYPSLMALPFFGFVDANNKIYKNTRKRILSDKNPYYIKGKLGESLGSAHTTRKNFWPLFTIMRGLTSNDEVEIKSCIQLLQKTAESTGYMHESVNIDNAEDYTRSWFAWANSFFGLLVNHIIDKYPNLLA